jgi:hypothetical protein
LPSSNAIPITIIGITAAAKIAVRPTTEYQAAMKDIERAVKRVIRPRIKSNAPKKINNSAVRDTQISNCLSHPWEDI